MVLVGSRVVDGRSVVVFTMVTAVLLFTGDTSESFRLSEMFPEKLTFSAGADEFFNVSKGETNTVVLNQQQVLCSLRFECNFQKKFSKIFLALF